MTSDTDIGKPLPRGVVDVQRDYVGAAGNNPGLEKQVAELKREVGELRREWEAENASPDQPIAFTLIVLAAGLGMLATAIFIRNRIA